VDDHIPAVHDKCRKVISQSSSCKNMNRRNFFKIAGGTILVMGGTYYLLSDKRNFTRSEIRENASARVSLLPAEREILYLASLAPSGHNTQPWLVKYLEPYHWIIGNDKSKWLPAVDPTHRETILSIGAFMQNLEYAAGHFGYTCQWNIIAVNNESENIAEIKLIKAGSVPDYDIAKIKLRRTLRSGYLNDALKKVDLNYLTNDDIDFSYYFPNTSKEHLWLNEMTVEANRVQAYRDNAQKELAEWIRFSSDDAEKYCDGLTTGSMELEVLSGWIVRNFFDKSSEMKKSFREKGIDKIKEQVSHSAGWIILTSNGNSVSDILEAGKRMQRLFLKVREKGIGLHPMTQILEEEDTSKIINQSIGINHKIQFLLRTGYVKNYPEPVSLRRPADWFVIM
jgi:nitroreductase